MSLALKVDERRLLKEIPAFFQSFQESLTELLQNAYRAGAKTMRITLDEDARRLLVEDDGPGAEDAEMLLTAGATGWQNTLVEPAGLGLFALLGLSTEIAIESSTQSGSHWRIRLTPACFEGEPVDYEDLPATDWTGLRIAATIKPEANLNFLGDRNGRYTFRHQYPLEVHLTHTLNGTTESAIIEPRALGEVFLDTPVGRLYRLTPERYDDPPSKSIRLVMEHRVLSSHNAYAVIHRMLQAKPDGDIIAAAMKSHYLLVVTGDSKIEPKLPDRREPITNQDYFAAMQAVADSVYAAFALEEVRARLREADIPEILDGRMGHDAIWRANEEPNSNIGRVVTAAALHPIFSFPREALRLVYRDVQYSSWDDWNLIEEDDVLNIDHMQVRIYARNPLLVQDGTVAEILCQEHVLADSDPKGEMVTIDVQGVRLARRTGIFEEAPFGICSAIVVRGADGREIARLERLALLDDQSDAITVDGQAAFTGNKEKYLLPTTVFLVAAEPKAGLEQTVRDAALHGYIGEALDYNPGPHNLNDILNDEAEPDIDYRRLRQEIAAAYTAAILPEIERGTRRYSALENLAHDLDRTRREVREALDRIQVIAEEFPEVVEAAQVAEVLRPLDALRLDIESYKV